MRFAAKRRRARRPIHTSFDSYVGEGEWLGSRDGISSECSPEFDPSRRRPTAVDLRNCRRAVSRHGIHDLAISSDNIFWKVPRGLLMDDFASPMVISLVGATSHRRMPWHAFFH